MPSPNKKPDVSQSAKIPDTPSADGTAKGTTDQSTTLDALRAKCQRIIRKMDECPQAFGAFVQYARACISMNESATIGSDELRRFIGRGFVTVRGTTFRMRHGEDAVVIRELCRRYPDLAPHIRPRLHPSKFDVVFGD